MVELIAEAVQDQQPSAGGGHMEEQAAPDQMQPHSALRSRLIRTYRFSRSYLIWVTSPLHYAWHRVAFWETKKHPYHLQQRCQSKYRRILRKIVRFEQVNVGGIGAGSQVAEVESTKAS